MLNLTLPAIPFDLIVSAIITVVTAFVFSFIRRSGFVMLLISIVISGIGFAAGQLLANYLGWNFVMIGRIHVIEGLVGSVLALFIINS
jgi:hypothetical protein